MAEGVHARQCRLLLTVSNFLMADRAELVWLRLHWLRRHAAHAGLFSSTTALDYSSRNTMSRIMSTVLRGR